MSPRIESSTIAKLDLVGEVGPFAMFSAIIEQTMSSQQLFGASIDVEDESSGTVAMFFRLFYLMAFI